MNIWPSNIKIISCLTGTWRTSTEVAKFLGYESNKPDRAVDTIEAKLRALYKQGRLTRREILPDRKRVGSRCVFEYTAGEKKPIELSAFTPKETEEERRIKKMKEDWQSFQGTVEYIGIRHIRFVKDRKKVALKASGKIKDYVLMKGLDCGEVKVWHKDGVLKWVEKL